MKEQQVLRRAETGQSKMEKVHHPGGISHVCANLPDCGILHRIIYSIHDAVFSTDIEWEMAGSLMFAFKLGSPRTRWQLFFFCIMTSLQESKKYTYNTSSCMRNTQYRRKSECY